MIWVERTFDVVVSDEMLHKIDEVIEGLGNLQDIMQEYGLHFKISDMAWFDYDDVSNAKELLETLVDSRCKFEE